MSSNYYASEILKVVDSQMDADIPLKFRLFGEYQNTKFLNLNAESASEVKKLCEQIIAFYEEE